jgi:aspartate/methionine/tyrosine aminotransferase
MSSVRDAAAARLLGIEQSPTAIDLSVGEPDFDTPPEIRNAGARALADGATRYTPRLGLPELREAIRARLARDKGYEPAFEDTIVTAGGSPGTCVSIAAACQRGDTILIPEPSWPNYELFSARIGVGCRRYTQRASQPLDLDEIEALVDASTRLIVVNSPANPTGSVVSRADTEGLVELAERHRIWILSDEAYEGIVFGGLQAWSPCALGGMNRTFAAYTFSKTYAMTGWRVGYLLVPPSFRRSALELQATMTGCAPAMAQRAAEYALAHGGASAETMRRAYERRRDAAVATLDGTGLLDGVPEGAFYLWLDVERAGLTGLEFTTRLADEAEVVVSAGEAYSNRSDHHVRVSFAVDDEQLQRALERLRATVERFAVEDRHDTTRDSPVP